MAALALTAFIALPASAEVVAGPDAALPATPVLSAFTGGPWLAPQPRWSGPLPAARPADIQPIPAAARAPLRPEARDDWLPAMRWDDRPDSASWTRATMAAVQAAGMTRVIPDDIGTWCPAYPGNDDRHRAAFWTGVLSALARYESGHNPRAVGGGGLYYGLLQILPSTARLYDCGARTGEALRDAEANLACAVRISARNVIRDDAVARDGGRNAGLARDWGPMTVDSRVADMAAWTREQDYCTLPTGVLTAPIPPARPWTLAATTGIPHAGAIELAMLHSDIRELRAIPAPPS